MITLLKRILRRKEPIPMTKGQQDRICQVCHENIKHGMKTLHYQVAHREYAFTSHPGECYATYYYCATCGRSCGCSISGVYDHYHDCHPGVVGKRRKV